MTDSRLVCYCYPKIGVEVSFNLPRGGSARTIIDVSDGLPVVNLGADDAEGSTAYSYYAGVVAPTGEAAAALGAARGGSRVVRRVAQLLTEVDSHQGRARAKLCDALLAISLRPVSALQPEGGPLRAALQPARVLRALRAADQRLLRGGDRPDDPRLLPLVLTQDQIAAAMGTGRAARQPARSPATIVLDHGLDATFDTSATWSEAKPEIDADRPLKSGIPGHARAAAGWMKTWSWSSFGYDLSLKIYDPWPWNADICRGGAIVWEDWDAVTTRTSSTFGTVDVAARMQNAAEIDVRRAAEERAPDRGDTGSLLFEPWAHATVGGPVLVHTVTGEPSYWLVPVGLAR